MEKKLYYLKNWNNFSYGANLIAVQAETPDEAFSLMKKHVLTWNNFRDVHKFMDMATNDVNFTAKDLEVAGDNEVIAVSYEF